MVRKVYGTFHNDLIRMRVWLKQLKVTEIAMESTGVYGRPVWNVIEDEGFRLLLVNPAHVKALAGRTSDGRMRSGSPNICRMEDWMGASCRRRKFASCDPCCGTGSHCSNSATKGTIRSGSVRNGEYKAVLGGH